MFPLHTAQQLQRAGLSLIPLRGDSDAANPKAPAVPWAAFQRRAATWREIVEWVAVQRRPLGLLTGRVWGIVVVDFDDMGLWERFSIEQPALFKAASLVVQTRRGVHLYLAVNRTGDPIPSRLRSGWDLKADGAYVVAPHARLLDHDYTIIMGSLEHLLNVAPAGCVDEIVRWLDAANAAPLPPRNTSVDHVSLITAFHHPSDQASPRADFYHSSDRASLIAALHSRFHTLIVPLGGRNAALFQTCLWARDHGLTMSDCLPLLADFLTAQALRPDPANTAQRSREFHATLKSAFSRPPRAQTRSQTRLPDAARQALSQAKLMHVWRLLDALYAAGITPGQTLTRQQALAAAAGSLGQRHTWQALSDMRFFGVAKGSPAPSAKTCTAESERPDNTDKTCSYSRCQNVQLNPITPRGRPQHIYTVPSPQRVCRVLAVNGPQWSSPLRHTSSREARKSLYAAKISHTPGRYSNTALSRWFGVSINTLKAYERDLKLVRRPQYDDVPLASWNIDALPTPQMGVWLQTPNGCRYPTEAKIAVDLLARGRVSLVRQQPNFICTAAYLQEQREKAVARVRAATAQTNQQQGRGLSLSAQTSQPRLMAEMGAAKSQKETHVLKAIPRHAEDAALEAMLRPRQHTTTPEPDIPQITHDPQAALHTLKRQWRMIGGCSSLTLRWERGELVEAVLPGAKHLLRDRDAALLDADSPRRVLAWLRRRMGTPLYTRADVTRVCGFMNQTLTRKNALRLIQTYGAAKVLRCAAWVATRSGLTNPTGYLMTCLRTDAVVQTWGLK